MVTREAEVMQDDDEAVEAEIMPMSAALVAADRAAIDIQVATARRYPRDIRQCKKEALALATLDEETAGTMFYSLPRKDKNGKRIFIEGPSIRFAEVVVYAWEHIRTEKRIVSVDDTHVTAQGTCMDVQKNIASRVEVQRKITNSSGVRFNDDIITMTANAAASVAVRNAVLAVIPASLVKKILDAAKATARGEGKPIEMRRQKALAWFAQVGKFEADVLELLGLESVNDIGEEQLTTLSGLRNAIMEGVMTVENAFANDAGQTQATSALNEKLKAAAAAKAGTEPTGTATLDAIRKLYYAKWNDLSKEGEKAADLEARRHAWQSEHMGEPLASTKSWGKSDFRRAIEMLESGIGL